MPILRKDKHGVPIISRSEMETRTARFLKHYAPDCFDEPRATPISEIALRLKETGKVSFEFGKDLGYVSGRKIRGSFNTKSCQICIDISLPLASPPFNFTLAHEIGHFILHKDVNLRAMEIGGTTIEDGDRQLVLDHTTGTDPRSWLEWQANKFASSLLLPLPMFVQAVVNAQRELGISRNLGVVYKLNGAAHGRDYDSLMSKLVFIFQTSRSAIRIRLRELNMLREPDASTDEQDGPRHILDPLRDFMSGGK